MSTTRQLQSHTIAGVLPSRLPVLVRRGLLPGDKPEISEEDTRLYSDVAASRPASPRRETVIDDPASAPEDLMTPVPA
jgi:hypothetical protein